MTQILITPLLTAHILELATERELKAILFCLETQDVTVSKFLVSLLTDAGFQKYPCTEVLVCNTTDIFDVFLKHLKASKSALKWPSGIMKQKYAKDIKDLAHVENILVLCMPPKSS
jgi:hypothetical protein